MSTLSQKLAIGQKGFTLIELVIVIVIIGILAAVAIPNFSNLTDDAQEGVANGVAGAFASAAATNYASCQNPGASKLAVGATGTASCYTGVKCDAASLTQLVTDKPTGYSVKTGSTDALCVIENSSSTATSKPASTPVTIKAS